MAQDTTSIKWPSTSILPPLEISPGRLEIDHDRDIIEYIPPAVERPWRLQSLERQIDGVEAPVLIATTDEQEHLNDFTMDYIRPSPAIDNSNKLQHRLSQEQMLQQLLFNRNDYEEETQRIQQARRIKLKELRAQGMDAILNNAQDAGDREIWMERHAEWIHEHEERLVANKERHDIELKRKEEYIQQTTGEYRRQAKQEERLRKLRDQAKKECCAVVILASATNHLLKKLKRHWERNRKAAIVAKFCRRWQAKWLQERQNYQSVRVLSQTLHEWSLISLSQRVAVGLRYYFRCVRIVQRRLKFKAVKRRGRMEVLLILWKEQEMAEKQIYLEERKAFRVAKRRSGIVSKRRGKHGAIEAPVEVKIVPEETRDAVLRKYLAEIEQEFYKSYLTYLEHVWPILVQLIYENKAGISRNEAKRQALVYRSTWTASTIMTKLSPSMNHEYPTFSLRKIPMKELMEQGRHLAFPPPVVEVKATKRTVGRRRN